MEIDWVIFVDIYRGVRHDMENSAFWGRGRLNNVVHGRKYQSSGTTAKNGEDSSEHLASLLACVVHYPSLPPKK